MRLPLDWLAEFIPLPPTAELVEGLNLGGFEDAAVENTGPDLSALRVGHVVEHARHPNADRLSVCQVDDGQGEPLTIVCGAPNVARGQNVAVARAGTRLPDGTKLKRSKIRGVASEGMICSARELQLGDDHEGILVLDSGVAPGTPLAEVLVVGGGVLEVGITPNRGDTASLLGLAREVRALFGGEIRQPEVTPQERGAPAGDAIAVVIDAPAACPTYVARVVRGVQVGPSPAWLVERLEAAGVRSINCVVDVTNLVLLEFGQPLHAFDLATLRGGEVRVRDAVAGEKLATLDGQVRELDPGDLVIADGERPIALAGVMGGVDSEVGDATTDVLIESAHFDPTRVRLSARRHGLHTEASFRFERGVDGEGIERAADRAARLMAELAGGAVAPGAVVAHGDALPEPVAIPLDVARMNRLLGTELASQDVIGLLERVDVACRTSASGDLACAVPSHRNDLRIPADLAEEVARIHSYARIATTEPVGILRPVRVPPLLDLADRARDALVAAGLIECVNLPFLAEADLAALGFPDGDPRRKPLRIANPIREEEPCLRTAILPSLLHVARQNRHRQIERIRIFEVSRVFHPEPGRELPREPLQVAAVVCASEGGALWRPREAPPLFFQAKGIAETLLFLLGYQASFRGDEVPRHLHPAAAVGIEVGGHRVGAVGELHPEVCGHFGLEVSVAVLELDLSALLELPARDARFREVSRQPAVRRDLAVVLDGSLAAGDVLDAVRKTAGGDCIAAEIFDRYEGRGIPAGRVSLAFRLTFQRPDRTLTDVEVTRAIDRVVKMLSHRFDGELR